MAPEIAPMDELLRSTVRTARLAFDAHSASIFMHDPVAHELALRCSSETGNDTLLDIRIRHNQGIAGWVFQSGEAIMQSGLGSSSIFDAATARSTGYVPETIVAAPVEYGSTRYGVMEVLDPRDSAELGHRGLEMAQELANHLGAALALSPRVDLGPRVMDAESELDTVTARLRHLVRTRSDAGTLLAAIGVLTDELAVTR